MAQPLMLDAELDFCLPSSANLYGWLDVYACENPDPNHRYYHAADESLQVAWLGRPVLNPDHCYSLERWDRVDIEMEVILMYRDGDQPGHIRRRALSFFMLPLDSDRIKVTALCRVTDVLSAWSTLLLALAKDWPTSADDIAAGLRKLGLLNDDTKQSQQSTDQAHPWDCIPDRTGRLIVELWREHWTAPEIANHPDIALGAGRVRNILTDLRKKYGVEAVPYHKT